MSVAKRLKTIEMGASWTCLPVELQQCLASFLPAIDVRKLRRVNRQTLTLPINKVETPTTCVKCRTHAVPFSKVYVEFYVDTTDDIAVLYTTDLVDFFVDLPADAQTPAALLDVLERLGLSLRGKYPLHACWIRADTFDDYFVMLEREWKREVLFAAQRREVDYKHETKLGLAIRVAGPIPPLFEQRIQDMEALQNPQVHDVAKTAQFASIAAMVEYHNKRYYNELKDRNIVSQRYNPKQWTRVLYDPDNNEYRKASIRRIWAPYTGIRCQTDFRSRPPDVVMLDDADESSIIDLSL